MIVVGLDLESTGLDKVNDRPTEVGLSLWTTKYNRSLDAQAFLVQTDGVKVSEEVTEITGINQSMVDNFGYTPTDAFDMMAEFVERGEAIVAFNGTRFDIPMCKAWASRVKKAFPDKLVIDPYTDLPMRAQELITMCAKMGIYYDPHEAGADVGAMLRLMAKFPFETVLMRAKSPTRVVQSKQPFRENAKAKKHKFRFKEVRGEKLWWKLVKEIDFSELNNKVNGEFAMVVREDLTPEDMEDEQ